MKNAVQKKLKGGTIVMLPRPTDAVIWVAKTFPPWQCCVLDTMREHYEVTFLKIEFVLIFNKILLI